MGFSASKVAVYGVALSDHDAQRVAAAVAGLAGAAGVSMSQPRAALNALRLNQLGLFGREAHAGQGHTDWLIASKEASPGLGYVCGVRLGADNPKLAASPAPESARDFFADRVVPLLESLGIEGAPSVIEVNQMV